MPNIKKSELRPAFVYLKQQGKSVDAIRKIFGVSWKTVNDAVKRFEETASNKNRTGSGRKRTAKSDANIQAVADAIAQNPSTKVNSTRKLARRLRISQTSVCEILRKELNLYPYKLLNRQELTPAHIRMRLERCQAMNVRYFTIILFINKDFRFSNGRHRFIIFSDEKLFTIEAAQNRQNDRIYATNPPETEERLVTHQQHPKQIMIWAAIGYNVKLPLVFIDSNYHFDQVYYRQVVLRETLKQWTDENLEDEGYCFQQV